MFADHFALQVLGVAIDVEAAALDAETLQKGVVAHPVGEQRAHPGHPLGPVIVSTRHSHRLGNGISQVSDARVLKSASGLGVAEEMVGVAQGLAE